MDRALITGLVLAGGRGSRMGGVDKGLQPLRGRPLALHALERLAPQVGPLAVNANRHEERYATLGVPVWPDADASFAGPLAGWLAGLARCTTPWLVTVACDTPNFPLDLVARLAEAAVRENALVAMASGIDTEAPAAAGSSPLRTQPVFSLLHHSLHDGLAAFLAAGERKVDRFTAGHRLVVVPFADDPLAFVNVNTLEELSRWQ